MSQRKARARRAEAQRARVDEQVRHKSGALWTSVVSSGLVAVIIFLGGRGGRRDRWVEWRSLWGVDPRTTPDQVHFEAFLAWLVLAYPLLVITTVALWLVDALTVSGPPRWVFFGLVGFALASGILHVIRGRMNLRTTRAAQLLAGWPQELVLLVACLGLARLTVGP